MFDPQRSLEWRLKAQLLRERASITKDPKAAAMYRELADEWDRKAASAAMPLIPPPSSTEET